MNREPDRDGSQMQALVDWDAKAMKELQDEDVAGGKKRRRSKAEFKPPAGTAFPATSFPRLAHALPLSPQELASQRGPGADLGLRAGATATLVAPSEVVPADVSIPESVLMSGIGTSVRQSTDTLRACQTQGRRIRRLECELAGAKEVVRDLRRRLREANTSFIDDLVSGQGRLSFGEGEER